MADSRRPLPDELVTLAQVLIEDAALREKFEQLCQLPPAGRAAALSQLAACMQAGRAEASPIRAVGLLKDPKLLDAVAKTVRELA